MPFSLTEEAASVQLEIKRMKPSMETNITDNFMLFHLMGTKLKESQCAWNNNTSVKTYRSNLQR